MNNYVNRRDVLKYSTTTVTGLSLLSGNILALDSKPEAEKSVTEDDKIPYDLSIQNNSAEKATVTVTASPKYPDGPVFRTNYPLQGLNNPGLKTAADARLKHRLDVSGGGKYAFTFELPNGSTDSTDITLTETGIRETQAMTVYVKPSGEVDARTVWG